LTAVLPASWKNGDDTGCIRLILSIVAEPGQVQVAVDHSVLSHRDMLSSKDEVAAAVNAIAAIMRRLPSDMRTRVRAEVEHRRLLRTRVRAQAEERRLDEVLDRLANAGGGADQEDGNAVGHDENRGPLVPGDLLFGLLIGVLAVFVLFAMLALLSLLP
jgi:hypothetical protein